MQYENQGLRNFCRTVMAYRKHMTDKFYQNELIVLTSHLNFIPPKIKGIIADLWMLFF